MHPVTIVRLDVSLSETAEIFNCMLDHVLSDGWFETVERDQMKLFFLDSDAMTGFDSRCYEIIS